MSTPEKQLPEVKTGDLVRVVSLKVTDVRHGINRHMKDMIDKEFFIKDMRGESSVHIEDEKNQSNWAFAIEDLELLTPLEDILSESMPTKPIMFNPEDLR